MPTSPGCRAWRDLAVVSCVVLALGQPITAQGGKQQRVLALYVTTPGAAGAAIFDTVYQKALGDALGNRLDFHSEYIDLARFSEPGYPPALAGFLRYKYQRLRPDLVLAPTEGARRFAERFRDELFPGIPVVFITRVPSSPPAPAMTGISAPLDLAATVDLALALQPGITRVFVVSGVSEFDRFYDTLARAQFQRLSGRVAFTYLSGMALGELERTVAHLPSDSILYFLTLGEDGAGARLRSTDALRRLSTLANVPTYGWNRVGMDYGLVGGRLYSNEIVAERSADLTLRILRGESPDSIPVATVDPYVTQLDWRELRRWSISEARVPAGAAILFREPTLWGRYKFYIVGALALFSVQTTLIAGLLVQRARRRRMEVAMRENQATLEASNRQISDLFGRLIAAQETERTRIARDLHDDVSQRIAGLAIMISTLKTRLRGEPDEADVMPALATMQRNTVALAEEIRHLSHDLHPSLLQHAGLVTALRVFCEQFEKLQSIAVTYRTGPGIEPVDADTALCLYRIVQEALRNVAKHAGARHVEVALTRTPDGVQLSITDDGKGFDLATTRAHAGGLGLVSIDERVRLLGGSAHTDTRPGGGTRMRVRIPQPDAIDARAFSSVL